MELAQRLERIQAARDAAIDNIISKVETGQSITTDELTALERECSRIKYEIDADMRRADAAETRGKATELISLLFSNALGSSPSPTGNGECLGLG